MRKIANFLAPFAADTVNALDAAMVVGTLESVTSEQMLDDVNAALVLRPDGAAELLQFRDAKEIAAGRGRLTTLLRGRRGTELFAGPHVRVRERGAQAHAPRVRIPWTPRFHIVGLDVSMRLTQWCHARQGMPFTSCAKGYSYYYMTSVLKFLCALAVVVASLAATQSPLAMSATDTAPAIMNAEMSMADMDCCPDMSAEECDEFCPVPAHCAAKCMIGILGILAQASLFELSVVVDPTFDRSLRARAMPPPAQPPKYQISAGA